MNLIHQWGKRPNAPQVLTTTPKRSSLTRHIHLPDTTDNNQETNSSKRLAALSILLSPLTLQARQRHRCRLTLV